MKEGQVEMNISGKSSDFDECILINRTLVELVNSLVKVHFILIISCYYYHHVMQCYYDKKSEKAFLYRHFTNMKKNEFTFLLN